MRGRATLGRLPVIRDNQQVRAGPLVLRRPFSAADEHPHARPRLPLLQNPARDLGLKFEEREGSNYEAMTHLNSAPEDLFAVV